MKKFFREFKEFITRGNVLDMAVGIIIGGAFRAIVNSLVADLIMPLISAVAGKDVSDWTWVIKNAVLDNEGAVVQEAVILRYGNFIQTIIDFLIISLVLFIIVKVAMAAAKAREALLKKVKDEEEAEVIEEPAPEPESSEEAVLLKEIVELLKEDKTEDKK